MPDNADSDKPRKFGEQRDWPGMTGLPARESADSATHRCPTCGHEVTLIEGDERTHYYIPVQPGAHADATNMAVAINFALLYFPRPEDEPDQMRAAAIGALQGALSAHRRRIGE